MHVVAPAGGLGIVVREEGMSRSGQVFVRMGPSDDWHAIGEGVRRQVPNPRRAVGNDTGACGAGHVLVYRPFPQRRREWVGSPSTAV